MDPLHQRTLHHQLPAQGSKSITREAYSILQKVWKGKSIPPFLKTFAWRIIRRAIATAERAGKYTYHIDKHCTYCGAIENDVHMFFFVMYLDKCGPLLIHLCTLIYLVQMRMTFNMLFLL
jgi:hypothetical protein